MVVIRSLNVESDPFQLYEKNKKIFGYELPNLNLVRTLMYFVNYTWHNVSFAINTVIK